MSLSFGRTMKQQPKDSRVNFIILFSLFQPTLKNMGHKCPSGLFIVVILLTQALTKHGQVGQVVPL